MSDRDSAVLRPSVPFITWLVLAMWIAVAGGEYASRQAWSTYSLGGCIAVLVVTALALRHAGRGLWTLGVIAALSGGMLLGTLSWASLDASGREIRESGGVWEGRVCSDPVDVASGQSFLVTGAASMGKIRVFGTGDESLASGRDVQIRGVCLPPDPEWRVRDRRSGVVATVSASEIRTRGWAAGPNGMASRLREAASRRLDRVPGEGGLLLKGVLVGDRRSIRGTALEADARAAGLAHLLAVSGTHLAVVAAFAAAIVARSSLSRTVSGMAVLVTCAVYVLLSGVQPSAVRALGLLCATTLGMLSGRRRDSIAALSWCVAVMLCVDATAAFSVGLMLSVSAVLGIVLFGRLIEEWVRACSPRWASVVVPPVAVCITAQVSTLPLTAAFFAQLPVLGVVSNPIAVPLTSLVLATGLAGLILECIGLGGPVLLVAGSMAGVVARLAHVIAELPWAVVPVAQSAIGVVGVLFVLAILWVAWPLPRGRLAYLPLVLAGVLALLLVGGRSLAGAQIVVLDVGQGDAILLRDGGSTLLVDTGEDPRLLREALARNGVFHVDGLVLTHSHEDHTGGASGLVGMLAEGAVSVSDAAGPNELGRLAPRYLGGTLAQGDQLRVGEMVLEVVWPPPGHIAENENQASVVLYVKRGEFTALLTGDAEEPVYEELCVEQLLPAEVDVLKVAHHGSAGGMSARTLAVLSPALSVISVGEDNDFGHPSEEACTELERCGSTVLRTDRNGDAIVEIDGSGWSVRVQANSTTPYETMAVDRAGIVTRATEDTHGVIRACRPQACVPDIRPGRLAPGAGCGPTQEQVRAVRGSGLQHEEFRWRERRGARDRSCCEHPAIHGRAPPGHREEC